MKFTTVVALAIVGLATAQPHGKHAAHIGAHQKRGGLVTEWVTQWVTTTVTKYIDGPETGAPQAPPATVAPVAPVVQTTSAAQFFEGATVAPVAPPPPPPTPSVVALPVSPPEAGAGAGANKVSSQQQNNGALTFYDLGLGACGDNDGGKDETENIVALSHEFMGTQSNGNPYCGKTITIQYNGKTTTALVKDKCMGCAYGDIDVSRHCFKEFASESAGRIQVTWWVN